VQRGVGVPFLVKTNEIHPIIYSLNRPFNKRPSIEMRARPGTKAPVGDLPATYLATPKIYATPSSRSTSISAHQVQLVGALPDRHVRYTAETAPA
jgi:hypothetical protein